jgi:hypothetical protein
MLKRYEKQKKSHAARADAGIGEHRRDPIPTPAGLVETNLVRLLDRTARRDHLVAGARKDGMMRTIRDLLDHAARTGEVIRIVYHGGSQPGTVREVTPIVVTELEMRAHDFASKMNKVFKLDKIEIPDLTSSPPEYDPAYKPPPEISRSIKKEFVGKTEKLERLGWHVKLEEDAISLHRFFKNGKVRKGYEVLMRYEEFSVGLSVELDGRTTETRTQATRPYHVCSRRFAASRSFGHMENAVALFTEEAATLAPAVQPNH